MNIKLTIISHSQCQLSGRLFAHKVVGSNPNRHVYFYFTSAFVGDPWELSLKLQSSCIDRCSLLRVCCCVERDSEYISGNLKYNEVDLQTLNYCFKSFNYTLALCIDTFIQQRWSLYSKVKSTQLYCILTFGIAKAIIIFLSQIHTALLNILNTDIWHCRGSYNIHQSNLHTFTKYWHLALQRQ